MTKLAPVTVRGARGDAEPAPLALPDSYDEHRHLGAGPAHALLDAIQRSAATGRRVSLARRGSP